MYVSAALIANAQTPELVQPRDGTFNNPASHTQSTTVFSVASGDQCVDTAIGEGVTMRLRIVGTIGLYEVGVATRPSTLARDGRDCMKQRHQLGDVVTVGFGEDDTQRNALRVAEEVVLRTRLTAIGWVRSSFFPPCTARTLELSAIAREKSILSASRRRDSNTWCR